MNIILRWVGVAGHKLWIATPVPKKNIGINICFCFIFTF
jgi:hypothetical protein